MKAPASRSPRWFAAVGVVLLVSGCTPRGAADPTPTPSGPVVAVGTGPEAESWLLAEVLAALVAAEGFAPRIVEREDQGAARGALEIGDVDLLPGYTGQAWLEVLGLPDPPADPRTSFSRVHNVDATNGIRWIRPRFELDAGIDGPPANATFGLFVRGIPSADADLRTITQLATRLAERPEALVCVDEEFAERPDGWDALALAYSIAGRDLFAASPTEAIRGVAAGDCLVGLAMTTDGRAWAAGLQLLTDPLQVFPAFAVTVQAREAVLEDHPALVRAVEPLAEELTTRLLGTWNAEVLMGAPVTEVATRAAAILRARAGREATPIRPAPTP